MYLRVCWCVCACVCVCVCCLGLLMCAAVGCVCCLKSSLETQ